ncbi:hypothetical protein LTR17_011749 [Elasticomyces elasticus]|nr:hypothetical protein LTR17_011749 [Elasticomyces elasticus]
MATTVQDVFDIAELFDMIMLQVSPQQLFVNIRVCKGWRNYITSSKPLQIHMFLLSGPATTNVLDVELNPWRGRLIGAYGPKGDAQRADTNPLFRKHPRLKAGWVSPVSSLRKTLLVRPAVKDATLKAMGTWGMHALAEGFGCTLGDVEKFLQGQIKALEDDGVDRNVESTAWIGGIVQFSVYSTRVYVDGIWRGDDKLVREGEQGRAPGVLMRDGWLVQMI